MRLLLDQGLPRSTILHLHDAGIEAAHVGDIGLATASDSKILDHGRQGNMIVVTLDADFHALLALSGVTQPSVIRIRIEGLRGIELARCRDDLLKGAMVSVTQNGVRVRLLPVLR